MLSDKQTDRQTDTVITILRLPYRRQSKCEMLDAWNIKLQRESKKQDIKLLPITTPNINRFSNFFH